MLSGLCYLALAPGLLRIYRHEIGLRTALGDSSSPKRTRDVFVSKVEGVEWSPDRIVYLAEATVSL